MHRCVFLTTWSRLYKVKAELYDVRNISDIPDIIRKNSSFIPYGRGRSYNDAPLSNVVVRLSGLSFFKSFNEKTGELTAEAGVTLRDIISSFLPRGWFLPVTPGTKYVTLAGAVASDVHGKNHHVDGSFCDWVTGLRVFVPEKGEVFCSPKENSDLFRATCGGMGLTGIITEVTLKLVQVPSSYIEETVVPCSSLEETLEFLERSQNVPFVVAWMDCSSSGNSFGRSLVLLGEFSEGDCEYRGKEPLNVLFGVSGLINAYTIKLFDSLYFFVNKRKLKKITYLEDFFYPLDKLSNWNRLYGSVGPIQYQLVVPESEGKDAIKKVLLKVREYDELPTLSVLKLLGDGNENFLSFPMRGYTLAMDFKFSKSLFSLFSSLDSIVRDYGGRTYLAKNPMFFYNIEEGYSKIEQFRKVRAELGVLGKVNSILSRKLGI